MNDLWLRVILAALISALGAIATFGWSLQHVVRVDAPGPTPVARVVASTNEVLKRPPERWIWQEILRHQELYSGEALRTSGNAEAQIQFIGLNTTVQLDPDTVIEIQEGVEGINLDFLRGNLLIKSEGDEGNKKITLQSGDQKVDLSNSEVLISKPTADAPLNMDVVQGEIKVLNQSATSPPIRPQIKLVAPKPNQTVYVEGSDEGAVPIEWKPLDPGYVVHVETGRTRSQLTRLDEDQVRSGDAGRMNVRLPIGTVYYRLVAKHPQSAWPALTSSVYKTHVRPKLPPKPVAPVMGASVRLEQNEKAVTLRWSNPGRLTDMTIELARTSDLKSMVEVKRVHEQLSHAVSIEDPKGDYYWRVSGRLPGSSEYVSSSVSQFRFESGATDVRAPLLAPILSMPQNGTEVSHEDMRNRGLRLIWRPVEGASSYVLTLIEESPESTEARTRDGSERREPKSYRKEIKGTGMMVRQLKPGSYTWSVTAKDSMGQESASSELWRFSVDGIPLLPWADRKTEERLQYKTEKPVLRAAWERGDEGAVSWRVRLIQGREPASESKWRAVSQPQTVLGLQGPGVYQLEVEALDAQGRVIAKTPLRTVEVEQAPPLAPPEFGDGLASEIKARGDGSVDLVWKPVLDAKKYLVSIKSRSGEIIRTLNVTTERTEVSGLKTGEYLVTLQSIDELGRVGPESGSRSLQVPEYSNLPAPKLKKVNVK